MRAFRVGFFSAFDLVPTAWPAPEHAGESGAHLLACAWCPPNDLTCAGTLSYHPPHAIQADSNHTMGILLESLRQKTSLTGSSISIGTTHGGCLIVRRRDLKRHKRTHVVSWHLRRSLVSYRWASHRAMINRCTPSWPRAFYLFLFLQRSCVDQRNVLLLPQKKRLSVQLQDCQVGEHGTHTLPQVRAWGRVISGWTTSSCTLDGCCTLDRAEARAPKARRHTCHG